MRNHLSIILFLFALAGKSFSQDLYNQSGNNEVFRHLTTKNGLSHNTVTAIIQDAKGFMWFGTEDGLNRYNGYSVDVYKHDPADETTLSHSRIRCLFEDKDGTLWIGTDEGLDYFDLSTEKFVRFNKENTKGGLSSNIIAAITQDKNGNLWVGTGNNGISILNLSNNQWQQFGKGEYSGTLPSITISSLAKDNDGDIVIGTNKGLCIYSLAKKSLNVFTTASSATSLSDNEVACLFVDFKNNIWIGTVNGGVNMLDKISGTFVRYMNQPGNINTISQNSVFSISSDRKNNLFIATLSGGLNKLSLSDKTVAVYRHSSLNPASVSANTIWSIYCDVTGTIWIGTNKGVDSYNANIIRFNTSNVLPPGNEEKNNTNVFATLEDKEGNLWIGVLGSGLVLKSKNGVVNYFQNNPANPNSLSDNNVFCVYEDNNGIIWIGTYNGLNAYNKSTGTFTVYKNVAGEATSLSNNNVRCITQDNAGNLWIGTYGGGLNKFNAATGKFNSFKNNPNESKSISSNIVTCLLADINGKLLAGTFGGGVCEMNTDGTFNRHINSTDANAISNNNINCMVNDGANNVWIGTYGGGLNYFNTSAKTFKKFTERNGLPNNTINGIAIDGENNLWISANQEICKLTFDKERTNMSVHLFDAPDGIDNKFNAGSFFKKQNGEVIFGGSNGFNLFNPSSITDNPYKPPVVITKFFLFEKPYFMDTIIMSKSSITLDYNQNFFSFEFAALNFTFPEKNKYAYKMEGLDNEWIYSGSRRYAQYTNIDAGTYTFRVKACNNDGVWNETGTALTIIITPPFWKTWWFYLCCAVAFIAITIGYIRFRTRTILKQYELLEHKVDERTAELRDEKEKTEQKSNELEKTLTDLRTTQDQLVHSEKMASLGQLTAGIAHEIQNPLNFVNNFSSLSKELVGELTTTVDEKEKIAIMSDLVQNMEKINHHGKRAERIVKSMLMHSRTGTGDKQVCDINKLVEEAINLSYTSARTKDTNFTCNVITNFDNSLPLIGVVQQDINRVILNLVNNALYAVNERKKKQGDSFKPEITVSTKKQTGKLTITVKDNGMGMPGDVKEKVFQPFFTTKPTGEGTGLGLSLSYDIITKGHHGTIDVASELNKGAEVIVSLPV
jgi:ligand-binding sensor domain-containing protein/signal transduction histidine kinase